MVLTLKKNPGNSIGSSMSGSSYYHVITPFAELLNLFTLNITETSFGIGQNETSAVLLLYLKKQRATENNMEIKITVGYVTD